MPLCSASALMQQYPAPFRNTFQTFCFLAPKPWERRRPKRDFCRRQTWAWSCCSLCGFIVLPQTDVDFFNWFVSFSRSSVLSFPIIFIQSSFPILHENIFANHETWWCWDSSMPRPSRNCSQSPWSRAHWICFETLFQYVFDVSDLEASWDTDRFMFPLLWITEFEKKTYTFNRNTKGPTRAPYESKYSYKFLIWGYPTCGIWSWRCTFPKGW